jgi:hypothetical protein
MNTNKSGRRKFLQNVTKASGLMVLSPFAHKFKYVEAAKKETAAVIPPGKIKFAVININHPHIYGMTDAIKRGYMPKNQIWLPHLLKHIPRQN